jgi:hypothetical protein
LDRINRSAFLFIFFIRYVVVDEEPFFESNLLTSNDIHQKTFLNKLSVFTIALKNFLKYNKCFNLFLASIIFNNSIFLNRLRYQTISNFNYESKNHQKTSQKRHLRV